MDLYLQLNWKELKAPSFKQTDKSLVEEKQKAITEPTLWSLKNNKNIISVGFMH